MIEEMIKAALQRLIKSEVGDQVFEGSIKEVHKDTFTADVELDTGGLIYGVRLRAVASAGGKSVDVLPKPGAEVVFVKISEDQFLLIACDEIEEYQLSVGNAFLKLTNDGFEIKKGSESLEKILDDMLEQMLKIYAPKDVAGITAVKARVKQLFNSN